MEMTATHASAAPRFQCDLCGYAARGERPSTCASCGAGEALIRSIEPAAAAALSPAAGKLLEWDAAATERLARVPAGFMRELVRRRVEKRARDEGAEVVTELHVQAKLGTWAEAARSVIRSLPWDDEAWRRIGRVPETVRGMVVLEVERQARRRGEGCVTDATIDAAMEQWAGTQRFHSNG